MLINATPHAVRIILPDGEAVDLPPSGLVARVAEQRRVVGGLAVAGGQLVPVLGLTYGDLSGLPEPQPNVAYIVSALAAQAARVAGRSDCYAVADTVRDEQGRIIGCRALAVV